MHCWVKRYLVSKSRCWTKIFSPLLIQALITLSHVLEIIIIWSSQHNHDLQIIITWSHHDHIIIVITFTGGGDHPGDDGWKELGLIWLCSQLCILLSIVLCIVFCILLFIVFLLFLVMFSVSYLYCSFKDLCCNVLCIVSCIAQNMQPAWAPCAVSNDLIVVMMMRKRDSGSWLHN